MIATSKEAVLKKVGDIGITLVVLAVLFGMLAVLNPRMRDQVTQLTSGVPTAQLNAPDGPVGVAHAVLAVTSDFAIDNPFMFSFAVVAALLFVLMLRT